MKKMKIYFIVLILVGVTFFTLFSIKDKSKKNVDNNKTEEPTTEVDNIVEEKELFEEYYDIASKKVSEMTLEEKVGQVFLIKTKGSQTKNYIEKYHPGGFVLFGADFKYGTKTSVTNTINNYQSWSSTPLIIAVDEEGGTVTRVSSYTNFRSEKFPSPQNLYKQGGFELIEKTEAEKINLLRSLGINLNFAPVADVTTNPNAYMYKRSFGTDAELTREFISRVVKIDVDNNFAGSLKHFPGYGNNVDTHVGMAKDTRSYEEFTTIDFIPFKAGIQNGVPTIMVSHNIVDAFDNSLPATLSVNIHNELRDELEFSGLIITDDLSMDAIKKYVSADKRAILAFTAGNDLIITGDIEKDYPQLLNAFKTGELSEEKLDETVTRIIAFKYQYGIIK